MGARRQRWLQLFLSGVWGRLSCIGSFLVSRLRLRSTLQWAIIPPFPMKCSFLLCPRPLLCLKRPISSWKWPNDYTPSSSSSSSTLTHLLLLLFLYLDAVPPENGMCDRVT